MKHEKLLTVHNMVMISIFAAVLSVLSQISIPLPIGVPITLQTFGVVLIGIVLGSRLGTLTILVYLLIGMVGFPVFASFKSGPGVLFGPTGGYLIGFIIMAFIIGLGRQKKLLFSSILTIIALLFCHGLGLIVYGFVTNTFLPIAPALLAKDFVTSILAIIIGREMSKRLTFLNIDPVRSNS